MTAFHARRRGGKTLDFLLEICCVVFLLTVLSACGVKVAPPASPSPPALPLMRYTIQAGAFIDVENAARLTRSLEEEGISAYYYRDATGVFKVRFGDFSTQTEAFAMARSLLARGIIDAYYIVAPDMHPAARVPSLGMAVLRDNLVETAEGFIGVPYHWGRASPTEGFDCSGLVMAVYQLNGLNLPRSSGEQFAFGTPVDRSALQKGDLVFFSALKGKDVSHVGLYTGDDAFIHAPGRGKAIRKDSLGAPYFTARYAGARTYLR